MRNYAVSCDWLQVYCENLNSECSDLRSLSSTSYTFQRADCSSRQFKDIYNVYNNQGDHYAVIQCSPFSSILDAKGSIIKLCNRELYKRDFTNTFISFLSSHGFRYKSISRIDVSFDCNTFCQGMKPRRLINGIMNGKILKNNQGKASLTFDTHKVGVWQGIHFGSGSSAVSSVMYNKTKELQEVKDKPYIRELWALNGIDDTKEVWRIEIRIKADATHVVKLDTGELFRLSPDILETQTQIESIFFTYAKQYFSFKVNNGTKNKSRMKDVPLFDRLDEITEKPIRVTLSSDATRSDRIFLKKLNRIKTELRDVSDDLLNNIESVRRDFCMQKRLTSYYYDKVLPEVVKRH